MRIWRVDNPWFELVDESDEERGDWAELYPNRWGFSPPWDGRYDT
jgi:formate hydrogenlyase regulatory protein HycA